MLSGEEVNREETGVTDGGENGPKQKHGFRSVPGREGLWCGGL